MQCRQCQSESLPRRVSAITARRRTRAAVASAGASSRPRRASAWPAARLWAARRSRRRRPSCRRPRRRRPPADPVPGPPAPPLPATLGGGRYRVKRFLGEGARKRVYLARDTSLDSDVAVAVVKTEGLDVDGLTRVRREAQAMGRLRDHPHIVPVFDIGQEGSQPYIVSQLLDGGSVDDRLRELESAQAPGRGGGAHRAPGGAGARARPRARHRPPRPEARQRLARARRHGEARRLRPRRDARPVAPHAGGDAGRHRGLHAARAGHGPHARRAERPLRARRDALRDGRRAPAVPRRRRGDRDLPAREHAAGGALVAQPRGPAGARGADPAAPREGPRRAAAGCGRRGGDAAADRAGARRGGRPAAEQRSRRHAEARGVGPFRRATAGARAAEGVPRGCPRRAWLAGHAGRRAGDREDPARRGVHRVRPPARRPGARRSLLRGIRRGSVLPVRRGLPSVPASAPRRRAPPRARRGRAGRREPRLGGPPALPGSPDPGAAPGRR